MDRLQELILLGDDNYSNIIFLLLQLCNLPVPTQFFLLLFGNLPHYRMPGLHDWIAKYLDHDFFALFRMNKETFIKLYEKVDGPEFHKLYTGGEPSVPGETQLLMTIWYLGKGEVFLSVAEKFNVVPSTVYRCTTLCIEKIISLMNQYIFWPNQFEFDSIIREFQERSGYPGVVGAIDGTNIRFKAPTEHQESYIDKNDNHSIKLQIVCTAKKLLTNIMVGFPGSVHDARVFRNSGIFTEINNGNLRRYFPHRTYHLVGDRAYPLLNWLMKPYLGDDRHLTRRQRVHNLAHSRTRIVVEHSIGLLKGRWLILKYINVNSIEKAIQIIAACCVLHNFCLLNGDTWDLAWDENIPGENYQQNDDNGGIGNLAALHKRDQIAELL